MPPDFLMFNFFLVLGLIPGTNFQITFNEWLIGVLALAIVLYARSYSQQTKQPIIKISQYDTQIHGFSFPISLEPEAQIARRAVAPLANTFVPRLSQVVRLARRAV